MKITKIILITLFLSITLLGTFKAKAFANYYGNIMYGGIAVKPEHAVFTYGGAVRPDANGVWFILNNRTHEPIGLKSVTQDSQKVQVHLSNCYDEVSTAYAVADEGFASQGLRPGLMMGLCEFTIWIYNNEGKIVDPATTYKQGNNIWIMSMGTD